MLAGSHALSICPVESLSLRCAVQDCIIGPQCTVVLYRYSPLCTVRLLLHECHVRQQADCAGAPQVFRGFYSRETVQAIRDIIEPEFEAIFRADPNAIRSKLGAPVEGGDGAGRNAYVGGLLGHPLWPQLEPLLHAPWHTGMLLNFLELLFGPFVQLDAFGITGTPAHAYPIERRGTLVDQGWHRDSSIANRYQSYGVGTPYAGAIDDYATPKYKPPNGVNLLIYLQDMNATTGALRIVQVRVQRECTQSDTRRASPYHRFMFLILVAGLLSSEVAPRTATYAQRTQHVQAPPTRAAGRRGCRRPDRDARGMHSRRHVQCIGSFACICLDIRYPSRLPTSV